MDARGTPDPEAVVDGSAAVDVVPICDDTTTDPLNCGTCGRSCLGGTCLDGKCQPVAVVQGLSFASWDGIYPWSLVLVGDSLYYSDHVLNDGWVWKVAKSGGVASPAIEVLGADATAEYCLGGGGGENANWLTSHGGHVYWHGCMNRMRDLDANTGLVSRIGNLKVDFLASTATHLFGTRQTTRDASVVGEVVSLAIADGTEVTIASYDGNPGYLAIDDTDVFWTDTTGMIMKVSQLGGVCERIAQSPYPQGIAVDEGYIYWTDPSQGSVLRVLKSGGAVETIASGEDMPVQITLDGEFVYWTDTSDEGRGSVMRARKSGGPATELATGQGTGLGQHRGPWAIAVDDHAVYWTEIFGRGAVMRLAK